MDCNQCAKRETCVELCEAAEKYASQDYVARREEETRVADMSNYSNEDLEDLKSSLKSNVHLTPMEKKILSLLGQGLTRKDIRQLLEITRKALDWHIHNLRKKAQ